MGHTWSTAGHVRGTVYVPSPRGVHARQSGSTSALTPWVIPRVMPQRVRHGSKKPAALVALTGAEATRATPAPAFSLTRAIVDLYAADKSIISTVAGQEALQMPLMQDDHLIQSFLADTANEPFRWPMEAHRGRPHGREGDGGEHAVATPQEDVAPEEMPKRVETMFVVQKYTVRGVDAAERRSTTLLRHTQGYARWSARSLAVRHRRIRDASMHGERR
jgi:hypothetical protein